MQRSQFMAQSALLAAGAFAGPMLPLRAFASPGGNASYGTDADTFTFGNDAIRARWSTAGGHLKCVRLDDLVNRQSIPAPREMFSVSLGGGKKYLGSEFAIGSGPTLESLPANPSASRYAERIGGKQVTVELTHPSGAVKATWRAILRDGSHYLRQEIMLDAAGGELNVSGLTMIDFVKLPDAFVVGSVDGSPIVSGNIFLALEHPFAQSDGVYDRATSTLPRRIPLRPGVPMAASSVIGVTHPGQMRREFLAYIERERAHPYRTFLHYNSWYDLGYFNRYTAAEGVERIHAFGEALTKKRKVKLESFLFDDGWDDPNNLWQFNSGFPDGFVPLKDAAAQYDAAPGAWLSPWGGYGTPHTERVASAKRLGYETNENGLALSGPKYYEYFKSRVLQFIQKGGVNQFKLDGTGDTSTVYPGSAFGSDFDAAIHLIETARKAEPNLYINLTTGTYPSPFWLRYCDSIWRGGYDHNFEGVGTNRQKWITYRDSDTYAGIVAQGPLYPINSLMLHGLIYAQHAMHLNDDPSGDFRDEIHSYFSTGTQLQEMYVTPALLSEGNWDDLAYAARWSAANADVLRDTHWIGGNPSRLDVYGWASWSPRKGILALRNPSNRAQEIAVDVQEAFELPNGAPRRYVAHPTWRGKRSAPIALRAGSAHLFKLEPFEVATFDVAAYR